MDKPTDLGSNRTGIQASPIDSKRTAEGAQTSQLVDPGDATLLAEARIAIAQTADPVGRMPVPLSVKGAVTTVVEAIKGNQPTVFLDKIGQRLAFERSGVRLYEALLAKLPAADPHPGGPTREAIERIRLDELRHFGWLAEAMRSLGGDATAMTPCADITAVSTSGIVKVLTDPRTTVNQCLDTILMVELADNDAWATLALLADGLGKDELAATFRRALIEEEDHLARVRAWVNRAVSGEAGIESAVASPPAPAPA